MEEVRRVQEGQAVVHNQRVRIASQDEGVRAVQSEGREAWVRGVQSERHEVQEDRVASWGAGVRWV